MTTETKLREALQAIIEQHGQWNNGIWAANIARDALAQPAQPKRAERLRAAGYTPRPRVTGAGGLMLDEHDDAQPAQDDAPAGYREIITGLVVEPDNEHRKKFPQCYVPLYTRPQPSQDEPVAHFGSSRVNENGAHITTVLGPVAIPQDAKLYLRPQSARAVPVAWRTFDGEGGYDYRTHEDNEGYAEEWYKRNPNHKGWVEPLYARPQPAKLVPMTDEEIKEMQEDGVFWGSCREIVRAVEAHHSKGGA